MARGTWVEVEGPICGWRAFRLVIEGTAIKFAPALTPGLTWKLAEEQSFRCRRGCRRLTADCECGLYARLRPYFADLAGLTVLRNRMVHGTPSALALCRLEGKVYRCQGMLRAERAVPIRVRPVCCECVAENRQCPPVGAMVCGHQAVRHLTGVCDKHFSDLSGRAFRRPHVTNSRVSIDCLQA